MKKYVISALAVALTLILAPLGFLCAEPAATGTPPVPETISVFLADSGSVEEMALRDYVISALAGEMPAAWEEEALRAQAAACAALARYLREEASPDPALGGAAVSTDPGKHQAYLSVPAMRELWGEDFETYYARLEAAVDETLPYALVYDGKPILAAFHAISPGQTESAALVWGEEIPYLVPAESEWDRDAPGFASEARVSPADFFAALGLPADTDPETCLGEPLTSLSGTLVELPVGGKTVSGFTLRSVFSLRSAAVRVSFEDGEFVLRVRGYGHGVGMSQEGARAMARQGADWREILLHYYPGTEIVPAA